MSSDITEGIGYLSGGIDPHSPPSEGLDVSPRRGSSSPGYDSNSEKPCSRKRTNTTSSGSGDKRTANKICRVCGDKAFSYNFNVITCESCKAFFRRNANKEKDIRCPFNENCEINIVSRRFCQRCRLAKCFEVGMKKEWIMTEEARLEKKQRVEENRERRLQDALAKSQEMSSNSPNTRDRTISDCRMEDNGNSQDGFLTVREYVLQSEDLKMNRISFSNDDPIAALTQVQTCNSHPMMDTVPTTAANSLADVSSTTSNANSMDVDPATTMSGNGFIPPSLVENVSLPALLPSVPPVDTSLMAQVAAQAVINQQQHQLAAAVAQQVVAQQVAAQQVAAQQVAAHQVAAHQVAAHQVAAHQVAAHQVAAHQVAAHQVAAQQVAAQQVAVQMAVNTPPITTTLAPLPKPVLPPTIATPILTAPLAQPTPTLMSLAAPDMVTIPRDMLLKLMENNTVRQANCRCTCICGRYPPGSVIVDEVTKSLLAAGNQNNSCNSCENKEEARLETAEDFQRNGLLPSEDSSVQWLNSSQPTVVDPSVIYDANKKEGMPDNSLGYGCDSYYPNATVLETQMQSITVDPNMWVLTSADNEVLQEIKAVNLTWQEIIRRWSSELHHQNGRENSLLGIRMQGMMRALNRLSSFRCLSHIDKIALLKKGCILYLTLRGLMTHDPKENRLAETDEWPFGKELFVQCSRLFISLSDEVRNNETAVSVMSLLALFDVDASVTECDTIKKYSEKFADLLRRLLFAHFKQDYSRARAEYRAAMHLLAAARRSSLMNGSLVGWDSRDIASVMGEIGC